MGWDLWQVPPPSGFACHHSGGCLPLLLGRCGSARVHVVAVRGKAQPGVCWKHLLPISGWLLRPLFFVKSVLSQSGVQSGICGVSIDLQAAASPDFLRHTTSLAATCSPDVVTGFPGNAALGGRRATLHPAVKGLRDPFCQGPHGVCVLGSSAVGVQTDRCR